MSVGSMLKRFGVELGDSMEGTVMHYAVDGGQWTTATVGKGGRLELDVAGENIEAAFLNSEGKNIFGDGKNYNFKSGYSNIVDSSGGISQGRQLFTEAEAIQAQQAYLSTLGPEGLQAPKPQPKPMTPEQQEMLANAQSVQNAARAAAEARLDMPSFDARLNAARGIRNGEDFDTRLERVKAAKENGTLGAAKVYDNSGKMTEDQMKAIRYENSQFDDRVENARKIHKEEGYGRKGFFSRLFSKNNKQQKNNKTTNNKSGNPTNKDANKSSVVKQAQDQSGLFTGTTARGRAAYNEMKTGRGMRYTDEQQEMIAKNTESSQKLASLRRQKAAMAAKGQDTSVIDAQIQSTINSMKGVGGKKKVKLDTIDRAMSGAEAVAQYYVGGTFGQSAARIGATAGAIYGLDYITSDNGY